eukprot:TRINITY_DN10441_c0_g1_i1.p1 TRINITY_DN10441_c0_g1~~TRINITY_DN10441_c0_g1_i1.p1  ORF type:complete len:602 (-),score=115.89 TRINITY_DN10441_c0_g1_i1:27-1832(-)
MDTTGRLSPQQYPLPEGWEVRWIQKPYFLDTVNKRTTWDDPRFPSSAELSSSGVPFSPPAFSSSLLNEPIKPIAEPNPSKLIRRSGSSGALQNEAPSLFDRILKRGSGGQSSLSAPSPASPPPPSSPSKLQIKKSGSTESSPFIHTSSSGVPTSTWNLWSPFQSKRELDNRDPKSPIRIAEVPFRKAETYDQFLERLARSKHIRHSVEGFIRNFQRRIPPPNRQREVLHSFIRFARVLFLEDEMWSQLTEHDIDVFTLKNLERYLMRRLFQCLFYNEEDEMKDLFLASKMRTLSFISLRHLETDVREDTNFDECIQELRGINQASLPYEKADCILRCSKSIIEMLKGQSRATNADSMIPVLIYVALKCQISYLHSNLSYISRFPMEETEENNERMYYYTQLVSVLYFIEHLIPTSLKIDPEEYNRLVTEATSQLENTKVVVKRVTISLSEKERALEEQVSEEMEIFLPPDQKDVDNVFPFCSKEVEELKISDLPALLNDCKILVKKIENQDQISTVIKERYKRVVKVKELGSTHFQRMELSPHLTLEQLKLALKRKFSQFHLEIDQVKNLPDCLILDDEDVQLIESGQELEVTFQMVLRPL